MTKPHPVTIVSHTHWDRAWYVTFQEFRARLVRLVDRLLDMMEADSNQRVFMLDGQMAVLEDYLEVRPHRKADIQNLCRAGRLTVGPWYVLPDEFLVSPEALIRNLMLGIRMGKDFGGTAEIGYVPDGFGHIAQLPQILRGFSIDNAIFWRGLGEEGESLGTEFKWRALDGSQVLAIWMPLGYHNISNLGYPIHWGDTSQMEFDPELAMQQIRNAVDALLPRSHSGTVLLMNGIDHAEAEPRLSHMTALANERMKDCVFSLGTIEEHLELVRRANTRLPEFCGELRWGKYAEILQGVYSTRIYIKQANHRVETLLERYAEPLAAIAWLCGGDVPAGTSDLLWTGWHWLLKNHAHDDIYGSGIDAVHDEMAYRFNQAEQIGQIIVRDNLRQISRQVDFTAQTGMPVLVYNPLNWSRQEMVVATLDFEFDDPRAGNFRLVDGNGEPVPCQVLASEPVFWMETLKANRKQCVRVAFPARVPACGIADYYVQDAPQNGASVRQTVADNTLWRIMPTGAENRWMAFEIEADGGIRLTDKVSGGIFSGLNHFEDVEDAGDEYSYSTCAQSQTLSSRGVTAQTRLTAVGENLATFEVSRVLYIPEELNADRIRRSSKHIALPITSRVTIYRDQPGLFFETEVENSARDHKLSVIFPSRLNPAQAWVDGSFAVLPRDIDLIEVPGWIEDPTPLMHQRAFTDLSENGHGLAIFNRGLPAVEVIRASDGATISLVLLRCVGWLSRDDLSNRRVAAGPLAPAPGAQCPGKFRFEYAVFSHAGDWSQVYPFAYQYTAPLLAVRADTHEGLELKEMNITRDDPSRVRAIPWRRGGPIPPQISFISVDPPGLVLSSLHRSRDGQGVIVRFYNLTGQTLQAKLHSFWKIAEAWRTNLNEEHQAPLAVLDEHRISLPARSGEVVTVELVIGELAR